MEFESSKCVGRRGNLQPAPVRSTVTDRFCTCVTSSTYMVLQSKTVCSTSPSFFPNAGLQSFIYGLNDFLLISGVILPSYLSGRTWNETALSLFSGLILTSWCFTILSKSAYKSQQGPLSHPPDVTELKGPAVKTEALCLSRAPCWPVSPCGQTAVPRVWSVGGPLTLSESPGGQKKL